jgi:hypothetical protein
MSSNTTRMQFFYTHKHKIIIIAVLIALLAVWLLMRSPQHAEAPERSLEEAREETTQTDDATVSDGTDTTQDDGESGSAIIVGTPQAGETVRSPLTVSGEARGYWFFEASFPLVVVDWDGKIIGEGYATAEGDWMTAEYVPFTGEVSFDTEEISGNYSNNGTLILQKANPSGLPEHNEAVEVPVVFE